MKFSAVLTGQLFAQKLSTLRTMPGSNWDKLTYSISRVFRPFGLNPVGWWYHRALKGSLLTLCRHDSQLRSLVTGAAYDLENHDNERPSSQTLATFATMPNKYVQGQWEGYTDPHRLRTRQAFADFVSGLIGDDSTVRTVVEIGMGNGFVLRQLANHYPHVQFTGIDFDPVQNVEWPPNLISIKGYASDLIKYPYDLAIATRTMTEMTPGKLRALLRVLHDCGVKRIAMNEIAFYGRTPLLSPVPRSRHLERVLWGHAYRAYMEEAGFEAAEWKVWKDQHHARPDIWIGQGSFNNSGI